MKIAIISIHFSIGHLSHLLAFYELALKCGHEAVLYINGAYRQYFDFHKYQFADVLKEPVDFDVGVLYSPSAQNYSFLKEQIQNNRKLIYVLHEPFPGFKQVAVTQRRIRVLLIHLYQAMCIKKANLILLCSKYAFSIYEKYEKALNPNYALFPLIFTDENIGEEAVLSERKYFSFIGGFIYAHGSRAFLQFVKYCYQNNWNILFRIATRDALTELDRDPLLQEMVQMKRLDVIRGRPLPTEEMNRYFRESICIWSAYDVSMQSGVLPKAFMMGTPVIAGEIGSFGDFVQDRMNGMIIHSNKNCKEIYEAYQYIESHLEEMGRNARSTFLQQFYFETQVPLFQRLLDTVTRNMKENDTDNSI